MFFWNQRRMKIFSSGIARDQADELVAELAQGRMNSSLMVKLALLDCTQINQNEFLTLDLDKKKKEWRRLPTERGQAKPSLSSGPSAKLKVLPVQIIIIKIKRPLQQPSMRAVAGGLCSSWILSPTSSSYKLLLQTSLSCIMQGCYHLLPTFFLLVLFCCFTVSGKERR